MTYRTDRAEYLTKRFDELFDTEREDKLPVWAQHKLRKLRMILMEEAANHTSALAEIERLEGERLAAEGCGAVDGDDFDACGDCRDCQGVIV